MKRVAFWQWPTARRLLLLLAAVGLVSGLAGCPRWKYMPPIPTDFVGWRYSQHNYLRKHVSQTTSSYRSGRYRYTVTTTYRSRSGGGRRVLRVADKCPAVTQANAHILRLHPQLLNAPFMSVDGIRIEQPGQAVPLQPLPPRRSRRRGPSGLQ